MTDHTIVIDTPSGIHYARLCALRGRLKLEMRGLRFKGRPTGVILREMGFKGMKRADLLTQLETHIDRLLAAQQNRPGVWVIV